MKKSCLQHGFALLLLLGFACYPAECAAAEVEYEFLTPQVVVLKSSGESLRDCASSAIAKPASGRKKMGFCGTKRAIFCAARR